MNIRILTEDDAQSYQNVRLLALQTNSEAFCSTYDREVEFSLATVKERNALKFNGLYFDEELMVLRLL